MRLKTNMQTLNDLLLYFVLSSIYILGPSIAHVMAFIVTHNTNNTTTKVGHYQQKWNQDKRYNTQLIDDESAIITDHRMVHS